MLNKEIMSVLIFTANKLSEYVLSNRTKGDCFEGQWSVVSS